MRNSLLIAFPLLTATAVAQLPAPTLTARVAPRAAWTAITTSGTSSTTLNQRADNPGAASNDKLYVFGGCKGNNTATTYNDLWAFDPVAGTFTQLIANNVAGSPAARGRASIAWNSTTNKLMVFGGNTRSGVLGTGTATLLNDMWEYDPVTNAWTDVTPTSGPLPSARQFASMTWDPVNNAMVLFGGQTNDTTPATYSNETWLFISGAWAQLTPTTSPAPRAQQSMVTRPDFNDCLMCCGLNNNSLLASDQVRFLDVWSWNGSDWTLLSDCDVVGNPTGAGTTWPASTNANQAVYDPTRKRVVVQGGQGIGAGTSANVLFLYDAFTGTTPTNYGGSPTNYTSEFDCLTNTWSIYANPTTGATPFNNNDTAIGRVSRYWGGYIPVTGKVYKACGQNAAGSGSNPTYNVYTYQANPLANATSYGAGCTGPGGTLTYTPSNDPWTGRTWTATCTNLGPLSLAMEMWGFGTAALPLNFVFPIAGLGCDLLDTADLLFGPGVVAGGQVTTSLAIPNTPSLAGATLFAQIAEMQLDLSFNWVGLYTSNGISLTVGAL